MLLLLLFSSIAFPTPLKEHLKPFLNLPHKLRIYWLQIKLLAQVQMRKNVTFEIMV